MKTLVYIILFSSFLMFLSCNSNSVIENKNKEINTDYSKKNLLPNQLEIYAFHGTRQCETCKNMKANTKATLDKYFANELNNGTIIFQIVDVDDVKNEKLAEKFQATGTALMLNKIVNGKYSIIDWSDFAFDKANDANTYNSELKTKLDTVLK